MTNTDTTRNSGSRSMTGPSEAAKAKAQRMIADTPEGMLWSTTAEYALTRFIQQVSDAAKIVRDNRSGCNACDAEADSLLAPFILPEPEANPVAILDEIICKRFRWHNAGSVIADELAERGIELRKVEQ